MEVGEGCGGRQGHSALVLRGGGALLPGFALFLLALGWVALKMFLGMGVGRQCGRSGRDVSSVLPSGKETPGI